MKKILSVVLAGAMILGMSVSAFAEKSWVSGTTSTATTPAEDLVFGETMRRVDVDGNVQKMEAGSTYTLNPGDTLYFAIGVKDKAENAADNWLGFYTGPIDSNWSINIKGNEYVEDASFDTFDITNDKHPLYNELKAKKDQIKLVKVDILDDLDDVDSETVKFELYIADNSRKQKESEHVKLNYKFANLGETGVSYDFTNDADDARLWKAPKGKAGVAVFDFNDDTFFTVKMVEDEKVVLNLSRAYDKKIDKAYNEYDADLEFYNFKGTRDEFTKKGELFIPSAKDDKYIYEVVDGELVEVEATYDDAYKVAGLAKKHKGYVIETKELGYYVVADDELVVAEEDDTTDATEEKPSTDKQNPAMGANDFVGAAVALAVVSVAAAGALALKK